MAHHTTAPQLDKLAAFARQFARIASAGIDRQAEEYGAPWVEQFEALLQSVYTSDTALENAVKGYGSFVMDSMRRQKRFETDREYPAKTYAQAAAEVYFNDDYMERQYLPGLLLSHFLWQHHYQQLKYFQGFFLTALQARAVTDFAEVGVGTGLYSRFALQMLPGASGVGLDISPLSLKFAQNHVDAFGLATRYQTRLQNILTEPPQRQYQAVLCVEVLEHLEDPLALLRALKAMTAPGGKLFVTAALNAAHADHIYLYRSPSEVVAQVEEAGLLVENLFFANAYAPAQPGTPVPSAVAMVLSAG